MSWRDARWGRIWSLISKYGFRAGLQDALARWSRAKFKVAPDVWGDYHWVLNEECPAALKPPASGPLRINWLIPSLGQASGGFLGVFRAIHQLELWGHRQHIYLVGRSPYSAAQSSELMRKHYFPIQTEIELFQGRVADSDAIVSTLWSTAYTAYALGNTARKFYFVQDLEYLFFPPGSFAEFVKQTYRWGFHGITLGQWIADVLQTEFKMECSPFGFSYDRGVYCPEGTSRPRNGKKRLLFYARAATERRGFELGILALSLVAKRMADVEFVLVGSSLNPAQLPFTAILPGVVDPAELAVWYRSCDAALVLSYTNPSLLPLELMACRCPVISNAGSNIEWLLTDETSQLADSTPEALAHAVLEILNDESIRGRKVDAGLAFAQNTNWIHEIRRIESALYRGLGITPPVHPQISAR